MIYSSSSTKRHLCSSRLNTLVDILCSWAFSELTQGVFREWNICVVYQKFQHMFAMTSSNTWMSRMFLSCQRMIIIIVILYSSFSTGFNTIDSVVVGVVDGLLYDASAWCVTRNSGLQINARPLLRWHKVYSRIISSVWLLMVYNTHAWDCNVFGIKSVCIQHGNEPRDGVETCRSCQ